MNPSTRRSFLAGGAAATGALLLPTGFGARGQVARRAQSGPPLARAGSFGQGVASGQPSTSGATLWTKLDGLDTTSRLQVEVSDSEDFRKVLYRQDVVADVENAFAVHHRADARVLRPGEQYFYRFYTCEQNSPVGRFRTARPLDSNEPVRVGFFSCQAYEAGFYTAQAALAAEDLDLVVCLGDYVYERNFYAEGGARADTTGRNSDGDVQDLGEYREKYALYHSDAALRELRRLHPMIAIWDDHEVEDNYARDLQGEATPPETRRSTFLERRAAGYRAWFEHMPRIREQGEPDRIYGRIPLGGSAEVLLLDQRQYRDDQPCGDAFFEPCAESEAPGRTYLGADQRGWLKGALADSRARWKVVGNQAMIMSLDGPATNEINKDQWDGYAAERADLLDFVAARGIQDVTFITGDIHTFFAGNVTRTGRGSPIDPPPVATEFVGGATTSEGILPPGVPNTPTDAAIIANNPHIVLSNQDLRGFGLLEASPSELKVTFKAIRTIKQPDAEVFELARFRVASGVPQVEVESTAPGVLTRPGSL